MVPCVAVPVAPPLRVAAPVLFAPLEMLAADAPSPPVSTEAADAPESPPPPRDASTSPTSSSATMPPAAPPRIRRCFRGSSLNSESRGSCGSGGIFMVCLLARET